MAGIINSLRLGAGERSGEVLEVGGVGSVQDEARNSIREVYLGSLKDLQSEAALCLGELGELFATDFSVLQTYVDDKFNEFIGAGMNVEFEAVDTRTDRLTAVVSISSEILMHEKFVEILEAFTDKLRGIIDDSDVDEEVWKLEKLKLKVEEVLSKIEVTDFSEILVLFMDVVEYMRAGTIMTDEQARNLSASLKMHPIPPETIDLDFVLKGLENAGIITPTRLLRGAGAVTLLSFVAWFMLQERDGDTSEGHGQLASTTADSYQPEIDPETLKKTLFEIAYTKIEMTLRNPNLKKTIGVGDVMELPGPDGKKVLCVNTVVGERQQVIEGRETKLVSMAIQFAGMPQWDHVKEFRVE